MRLENIPSEQIALPLAPWLNPHWTKVLETPLLLLVAVEVVRAVFKVLPDLTVSQTDFHVLEQRIKVIVLCIRFKSGVAVEQEINFYKYLEIRLSTSMCSW